MLKVNRLMCLLCLLFLFNSQNTSTITPFRALATEVVNNNSMEMVHKDNLEKTEKSFDLQDEKLERRKLEKDPEIKKQRELEKEIQLQKQKEIEIQKQKEKENEEKKNKLEYKEFILTFYTSLECENSSAGAVTCQNKPLMPGGVANNVIPQNTKIHLEGYGQVTVNDRGSDKYFGVDNRLDVYIPREPGENDQQYSRRVNSYGIQKVQGYIIK